jgi:maleylacetate reductase
MIKLVGIREPTIKPATCELATDFMDEFQYVSYQQEVIFAPGALARLGQAVDRFGWQRLMLCTNHSLSANGRLAALADFLGERLVAVYDQVKPHVQDFQVSEALQIAVENQVDALIGMGGGSPIGMAKAIVPRLVQQRPTQSSQAGSRLPAVIAIPTTYSGSEMTPVYGITHAGETPPRKVTTSDPRSVPGLVVYDPELTLDLPPEMTASTGINALAHCFEALYSIRRNPLSSAAAIAALRYISSALLRCYQHGDDLQARSAMLTGSHLAGLSLASVAMGLHHGLCHVLGGSANVPHGIANSIILPHAIHFNADATADLLLPAALAMGVSANGLPPVEAVRVAARQVYTLVGQMNLPRRLRDAGVQPADLPRIAQLAFQNHTVQNNPKPITAASQIEELLLEAW